MAVTPTHILNIFVTLWLQNTTHQSWLCFQNLAFLTKISELQVKVITAGGQLQDVDRLLVIMVKWSIIFHNMLFTRQPQNILTISNHVSHTQDRHTTTPWRKYYIYLVNKRTAFFETWYTISNLFLNKMPYIFTFYIKSVIKFKLPHSSPKANHTKLFYLVLSLTKEILFLLTVFYKKQYFRP